MNDIGIRKSRIALELTPGNVVTTPRSDMMYVVTEFGMVNLKGKSVPERAKAMISTCTSRFSRRARARSPRARIDSEAPRVILETGKKAGTDSRCRPASPYFRSITTSRYSLGSTSVWSPERLRLSMSASSSWVNAACFSASSAAKVLFIGP